MSAINSLVNIDVINKGSHSIILTSYIANGTLISYQVQVDVKSGYPNIGPDCIRSINTDLLDRIIQDKKFVLNGYVYSRDATLTKIIMLKG